MKRKGPILNANQTKLQLCSVSSKFSRRTLYNVTKPCGVDMS